MAILVIYTVYGFLVSGWDCRLARLLIIAICFYLFAAKQKRLSSANKLALLNGVTSLIRNPHLHPLGDYPQSSPANINLDFQKLLPVWTWEPNFLNTH